MEDIVEQIPNERDEEIYEAWQSGKTLRVLAREFRLSVTDVERTIDRCLPPFNASNQMRAYKRELQKLDDIGAKYHALAMADDSNTEFAHIFARINERRCSMAGWSSISVRLDPVTAQAQEQPSDYEKIRRAVFGVARGDPDYKPKIGNSPALPPPDDTNGGSDPQ